MDLKKNLKSLIKESDVSLSSLSETINIPLSTLHGWMNGVEPKSIPHLKELANYFSISMDELCFNDKKSSHLSSEPLEQYKEEINAGTFEVILRRKQR